MKVRPFHLGILCFLLFLVQQNPTRGAITGQWDFKGGNLSATIGQDMSYLDADTQSRTLFGTTTSFAIADIGGQATNVMGFPKAASAFGGYCALDASVRTWLLY